MLEHLKTRDRHAELLACLGIGDGLVEQRLHRPDRFRGQHETAGVDGPPQKHPALAVVIQALCRRHGNGVEIHSARAMAVHGRKPFDRDARRVHGHDEQLDTVVVDRVPGAACRDDRMRGLRRVQHGDLFAVDLPALGRWLGTRFDISRIAARARFLPSQYRQDLAGDQARQQRRFQVGIRAVRNRLPGQPDHTEIRLDHERAAEAPHQPERVGDGAAEPAVVFGKGDAEPAEFGELLPVIRRVSGHGFDLRPARIEAVVVAQKLVDAVVEHGAHFGRK